MSDRCRKTFLAAFFFLSLCLAETRLVPAFAVLLTASLETALVWNAECSMSRWRHYNIEPFAGPTPLLPLPV